MNLQSVSASREGERGLWRLKVILLVAVLAALAAVAGLPWQGAASEVDTVRVSPSAVATIDVPHAAATPRTLDPTQPANLVNAAPNPAGEEPIPTF